MGGDAAHARHARMTSSRPLEVLHLVDAAPALTLLEALRDATDPADARLTIGELEAPSSDSRGRRYASAARAMALMIGERRLQAYDVVHTHMFWASAVGLPAARAARTYAVMTAHHVPETALAPRSFPFRADRLMARRLAQAVVAPSPAVAETLARVHGVARGRIRVIEHGFAFADEPLADATVTRAALGIAEQATIVLAVGRMHWMKNFPALVRAFADLGRDDPSLQLVVVGAGVPAGLQAIVTELGLGAQVSLYDRRRDVASLLAACHLVAAVSVDESFGQVVVEAMAAGRPVVTTPVGIAKALVRDGETGFLAADATQEAITTALRNALRARAQWPAVGARASASARTLTARRMADLHVALYRELTT